MKKQRTQGSQLTLETSTYPASELFKPKRIVITMEAYANVAYVVQRVRELMAQPVPPTREEIAYESKWGGVRNDHTADDYFDASDLHNWKQQGIYWVRQVEGAHPNCHCTDRLGAHAWWRHAEYSYCCAGFPYFTAKSMENFHKGMEMVKPIATVGDLQGKQVVIALERTLEGPIGDCWGICTAERFWRVYQAGNEPVTGERVPYDWTALGRALANNTTLK